LESSKVGAGVEVVVEVEGLLVVIFGFG